MNKGRMEEGIPGKIQDILGRIDLFIPHNVDSDTSVYYITHFSRVQFILCQAHTSQLLHIFTGMTQEEHSNGEILELWKKHLHKHWFSLYFW